MLWPEEHNFARFREVCDDILTDDIDIYREGLRGYVKTEEARGIEVEWFEFDPNQLLIFALAAGFERCVGRVCRLYALALQTRLYSSRENGRDENAAIG